MWWPRLFPGGETEAGRVGLEVPTAAPQHGGVFSHLGVSGPSWQPRMGVLGGVTLLGSWAGSHRSLLLRWHGDHARMMTTPALPPHRHRDHTGTSTTPAP